MADSDSKRGKDELAKTVDRERDYLKIQVLSTHYSNASSLRMGLITGLFVGLIILLATQDFEGKLSYPAYILGLALVTAFFIGVFWRENSRYQKDLEHISKLIENVDSGKPLLPLKDLV